MAIVAIETTQPGAGAPGLPLRIRLVVDDGFGQTTQDAEVPDQDGFFAEVSTMLNPGGRLLVVEPPFHVGRRAFGVMIDKARNAGLSVDCKPRMFPDKAVVFRKKQ